MNVSSATYSQSTMSKTRVIPNVKGDELEESMLRFLAQKKVKSWREPILSEYSSWMITLWFGKVCAVHYKPTPTSK